MVNQPFVCVQIASDGLKGRVIQVSLADLQNVSLIACMQVEYNYLQVDGLTVQAGAPVFQAALGFCRMRPMPTATSSCVWRTFKAATA